MNDAPPASPAAEVDSAAQAADASNEEPAVVSLNSISSPTTVGTPQASPNPSYAEETKPIEEKEKVRSEFFQKITKLGDETNVPSKNPHFLSLRYCLCVIGCITSWNNRSISHSRSD